MCAGEFYAGVEASCRSDGGCDARRGESRYIQTGRTKSKLVSGQKGFTTTRTTITIISTVGTSLTIRQCRADLVFLSCAKARTLAER